MQSMEALGKKGVALMSDEVMVKCTRCESDTPDSEILHIGSAWICGNCWDDI